MSTFNIGDRPFPAIIHVKRGNELCGMVARGEMEVCDAD